MIDSLDALHSRLGWRATLVIDASFQSREDFYRPSTSKQISNAADLDLLKRLRSLTDVIVTTGETARAEQYRASKYAPIVVLTRNQQSVLELPLFDSEQNITLKIDDSSFAQELTQALKSRGFHSFLFEGGLTILDRLLAEGLNLELVLSVTGSEQPDSIDAAYYLSLLFPNQKLTTTSTFIDRGNLVVVAQTLSKKAAWQLPVPSSRI